MHLNNLINKKAEIMESIHSRVAGMIAEKFMLINESGSKFGIQAAMQKAIEEKRKKEEAEKARQERLKREEQEAKKKYAEINKKADAVGQQITTYNAIPPENRSIDRTKALMNNLKSVAGIKSIKDDGQLHNALKLLPNLNNKTYKRALLNLITSTKRNRKGYKLLPDPDTGITHQNPYSGDAKTEDESGHISHPNFGRIPDSGQLVPSENSPTGFKKTSSEPFEVHNGRLVKDLFKNLKSSKAFEDTPVLGKLSSDTSSSTDKTDNALNSILARLTGKIKVTPEQLTALRKTIGNPAQFKRFVRNRQKNKSSPESSTPSRIAFRIGDLLKQGKSEQEIVGMGYNPEDVYSLSQLNKTAKSATAERHASGSSPHTQMLSKSSAVTADSDPTREDMAVNRANKNLGSENNEKLPRKKPSKTNMSNVVHVGQTPEYHDSDDTPKITYVGVGKNGGDVVIRPRFVSVETKNRRKQRRVEVRQEDKSKRVRQVPLPEIPRTQNTNVEKSENSRIQKAKKAQELKDLELQQQEIKDKDFAKKSPDLIYTRKNKYGHNADDGEWTMHPKNDSESLPNILKQIHRYTRKEGIPHPNKKIDTSIGPVGKLPENYFDMFGLALFENVLVLFEKNYGQVNTGWVGHPNWKNAQPTEIKSQKESEKRAQRDYDTNYQDKLLAGESPETVRAIMHAAETSKTMNSKGKGGSSYEELSAQQLNPQSIDYIKVIDDKGSNSFSSTKRNPDETGSTRDGDVNNIYREISQNLSAKARQALASRELGTHSVNVPIYKNDKKQNKNQSFFRRKDGSLVTPGDDDYTSYRLANNKNIQHALKGLSSEDEQKKIETNLQNRRTHSRVFGAAKRKVLARHRQEELKKKQQNPDYKQKDLSPLELAKLIDAYNNPQTISYVDKDGRRRSRPVVTYSDKLLKQTMEKEGALKADKRHQERMQARKTEARQTARNRKIRNMLAPDMKLNAPRKINDSTPGTTINSPEPPVGIRFIEKNGVRVAVPNARVLPTPEVPAKEEEISRVAKLLDKKSKTSYKRGVQKGHINSSELNGLLALAKEKNRKKAEEMINKSPRTKLGVKLTPDPKGHISADTHAEMIRLQNQGKLGKIENTDDLELWGINNSYDPMSDTDELL